MEVTAFMSTMVELFARHSEVSEASGGTEKEDVEASMIYCRGIHEPVDEDAKQSAAESIMRPAV